MASAPAPVPAPPAALNSACPAGPHTRLDGAGAPVECCYVARTLDPSKPPSVFNWSYQQLRVGAAAALTASERAFVAALEALEAFMGAEAARYKGGMSRRIAETARYACRFLTRDARRAESYEERCFAAHCSVSWELDIAADDGGDHFAMRALTRSFPGAPLQERRAQCAALLAALVTARDAAYPVARARALAPLFGRAQLARPRLYRTVSERIEVWANLKRTQGARAEKRQRR